MSLDSRKTDLAGDGATPDRPASIPVTVLVQTKDEAAGIRRCLEALGDFDEVVVVDSLSEDGTADIARACGARVVDFAWDGRYPKKKQWQLEHVETRNEWVLMLDADETPTPELVAELRTADLGPYAAIDLRLDYVFAGRTLRHGHRVVKRSLVRRGRVAFPVVDDLGVIGGNEVEGHYQPRALGEVGRLRGRLRHDDVDPVRTWFERHNRYSDWEATLRLRDGTVRDAKSPQGRRFQRMPFKPLVFFGYSYVARGGFLDGRAGFDYAVALAMYYWQIGVKERELRRGASK